MSSILFIYYTILLKKQYLGLMNGSLCEPFRVFSQQDNIKAKSVTYNYT